jgi:hypothetical protein
MGGDKMTNSRSAIKEVIDAMDKEDSLSFVIYDDKAKIVFENGDLSTAASKAELKALVDRVNAEGGTNIGCGLNLGAKVLNLPGFEGIAGNLIASASAAVKKLVGSNSSDDARPKRLFLFSDGQTGKKKANERSCFMSLWQGERNFARPRCVNQEGWSRSVVLWCV